ncbi:hypothetical protein ACUXZZ_24765 [Streptomyces graminifolii]|uniref:hypothetical protein n=1 Tax=Streptomyces graminifolii TaxID=1266771 RepID=UPI004057F0CB
MKSATAITKVYGDDQKSIAVAVEYDTEIDTSRLSASSFEIEGRTVTRVHANTGAAMATQPSASSSSSPYVIPGPQVGSTGGPVTTPRSRRVRPWPEARLRRRAYLFGAWVTA